MNSATALRVPYAMSSTGDGVVLALCITVDVMHVVYHGSLSALSSCIQVGVLVNESTGSRSVLRWRFLVDLY